MSTQTARLRENPDIPYINYIIDHKSDLESLIDPDALVEAKKKLNEINLFSSTPIGTSKQTIPGVVFDPKNPPKREDDKLIHDELKRVLPLIETDLGVTWNEESKRVFAYGQGDLGSYLLDWTLDKSELVLFSGVAILTGILSVPQINEFIFPHPEEDFKNRFFVAFASFVIGRFLQKRFINKRIDQDKPVIIDTRTRYVDLIGELTRKIIKEKIIPNLPRETDEFHPIISDGLSYFFGNQAQLELGDEIEIASATFTQQTMLKKAFDLFPPGSFNAKIVRKRFAEKVGRGAYSLKYMEHFAYPIGFAAYSIANKLHGKSFLKDIGRGNFKVFQR